MRFVVSSIVVLLLCFRLQATLDNEKPQTHIGESIVLPEGQLFIPSSLAIVGAGIAGITTAYWLKYYLNDSVALTIYDKNEVSVIIE
jgi:Mn2+/Fe2+ NRAMP family transporter